MITFPVSTFVLLLAAAFLAGIVVYDFVATVFIPNKRSDSMFTRRNYPIRLTIYGSLAVLGAGIYMFFMNWVTGLVLIVGAIIAIVGVVWHSALHPKDTGGA